MSIKISGKITDYAVVKPDAMANADSDSVNASTITTTRATTESKPAETEVAANQATIPGDEAATPNVVQMHEKVERPDMLVGSTYKIKTPLSDHALYVTINDIVLNPQTPYEKRRPFEIFINSKNMDHFQWIVALTRIISAVFRKGGDVTFLVEELRSVFDPQGGYFKRGGRYTPSLVAEIGDAIDAHMRMIGMIRDEEPDEHRKKLMDDKRREFEQRSDRIAADAAASDDTASDLSFPDGASLCRKCQTKAVVMLDGCMTCLNCGDSKCG
ncbi:MAG: TSCPD domain-containing protein [marine bacterium B5-7]|nr:MAG: TSCPD domain-containing protein [marine bacterium B5-7]